MTSKKLWILVERTTIKFPTLEWVVEVDGSEKKKNNRPTESINFSSISFNRQFQFFFALSSVVSIVERSILVEKSNGGDGAGGMKALEHSVEKSVWKSHKNQWSFRLFHHCLLISRWSSSSLALALSPWVPSSSLEEHFTRKEKWHAEL